MGTKSEIKRPPYTYQPDKHKSVVLPVTLAIVGVSVMAMAVMLFTAKNDKPKGNGNYDVENYDVVDNIPFIYGICE